MATALLLPPRFFLPQLFSPLTSTWITSLLGSLLLSGAGAGGHKHSHAKTRTRNQDRQKQLKPLKNFSHCQACGRVILPGHLCPYCLSYITMQFKGALRAELDRPTLDDRGLFITRQPDLERMPSHEYERYQRSSAMKRYKWDAMKEEHEEREDATLARVNARRSEKGFALRRKAGDTGKGLEPEKKPSFLERMRAKRQQLLGPGR